MAEQKIRVGLGRGAARILVLTGLCLLAGCGASRHQPLPAAEPAHDARTASHIAGSSVPVGGAPQGIAVGSGVGIVAVGVHTPAVAIVTLNARNGRVLRRIPIAGAPRHLALATPDGPLLVPEERRDVLVEIPLPSGRIRQFHTGAFPHAVAEVGSSVFVGNERGGTLTQILPAGRERTIGGFRQPGGLAAVDGDLAVVDVAAFTLTLLDPADDRVIGRVPAGAGPTHDVAAAGRVYVIDTRGDAVLTYTARPLRRLGRTAVGGSPYGVAIDPVRRRLWVTETATNQLAELSLSGPIPRLIRTYATGRQPDTVAVDSRTGRVFVANQLAGTVQIIDPR